MDTLTSMPVLRREITKSIFVEEKPKYTLAKRLVKLVNVISGCTNTKQIVVANNYVTLFNERHNVSENTRVLIRLLLTTVERKTALQ